MSETETKSQWFARIAGGDKEAFDAFFAHYYPKLINFARIFIRCEQQAEDVVADVLTNLLSHRKRVFALPHFEAYLYTAVKNKALSSLKKQKSMSTSPAELYALEQTTGVADPYELLIERELRALVRQIIRNFPPKRQMAFQLFREEGLSYQQVADAMHISERTVEVHLRIAVKTLREGVEKHLSQQETKKAVSNLLKLHK